MLLSLLLVVAFLAVLLDSSVMSYEWTSHNHNLRPEVTRRAIAGLWRLTPHRENKPLKEFTVYPKTVKKSTINQAQEEKEPELLLMLKEDGSFQQYAKVNDDVDNDSARKEDSIDADASWQKFQEKRKAIQKDKLVDLVKGIWDYRDGNLILADDRPDEKEISLRRVYQDTLLVGRVVATYGNSLDDNPALVASSSTSSSSSSASSSPPPPPTSTAAATSPSSPNNKSNKLVDAHLSVPKGSLNVGKFFYPKTHPSFFEQPIYNPKRVDGSFQLRQVLGSLNTQQQRSSSSLSPEQQFQRGDFYNKTFWLTSHPLGRKRKQPKGNLRWSIKYNKYVQDPPKQLKQKKQAEDDDSSQPGSNLIRVMQVVFFPNNTFCTVAGIGDSSILRGKFDVMGNDRDHLWMQVMRFGFGRSVRGSVYSEGRMLSQDDAKAYWGKITRVNSTSSSITTTTATTQNATTTLAAPGLDTSHDDSGDKAQQREKEENDSSKTTKLEVQGSVMLGWGLEPLPVARFIMKELEQIDDDDDVDDDNEDDDDEEEDDLSSFNSLSSASSSSSASISSADDEAVESGDDGIDWSNNDGFQ
jgi:hypothetical protein